MKPVHLEGMGVVGCLVAARFHLEGIDFTWSDTEAERTAWKVSTGAIPVFGDEQSHADRREWLRWYKQDDSFGRHIQHYMTKAVWCYTAQNPPHKARDIGCRPKAEVGPIKVSNKCSLHMDVQRFVLETRQLFARQRTPGVGWGSRRPRNLIVTHGFGSNIHAWSWGWSGQVVIELSDELQQALRRRRPCFYLRNGYQLPYLYPVGREREYYAGTTLITQKQPRSLPIVPKLQVWRRHVEEYSGGHIAIAGNVPHSLGEGWRPMAALDAPLIERVGQHTLRIRPQYGNGLRHFPSTYRALREAM